MPYVSLGDFRLYYETSGPAASAAGRAPVVLLHGFTLDRRMWSETREFLAREFPVIVPDARGHGRSDAPATGYSRADRVEDLARFADRLGLERFHLVGLSMGGSTALGYALRDQARLVSLTLVSTSAAGWNIGRKMERAEEQGREIRRRAHQEQGEDFAAAAARGLAYVRERWIEYGLRVYREDQRSIRDRLEQMMREYSGAAWLDERRGKYPSPGNDVERVHTITAPTLIVAGEKDKVFAPLAQELGKRIAGSRVIIHRGVGHMVNMEIPEQFDGNTGAFLRAAEKV